MNSYEMYASSDSTSEQHRPVTKACFYNQSHCETMFVVGSEGTRMRPAHGYTRNHLLLDWTVHYTTIYTSPQKNAGKRFTKLVASIKKRTSKQSEDASEIYGRWLGLLLDPSRGGFGQSIAYLPLSLGVFVHLPRGNVGLSFQRFPHKEFQPP